MKEYIKRIVRYISAKPVIGWPVRLLVAFVRLPQTRNMVFESSYHNIIVDQQIHEVNQQIGEITQQVSEVSKQISEVSKQISEVNQKIDDLKHRQNVFEIDYLPGIKESLVYQENLKLSLPVVLRQHRRSILKQENSF